MNFIGIVRKVDTLGRIVVPIEIRNLLGIENEGEVEIRQEKKHIIINKYQQSCVFCNSEEFSVYYKNMPICNECLEKMI